MYNFFDFSQTPENMYFWGFLWSDGYIKTKGFPRVELDLNKYDFDDIINIIPKGFNIYNNRKTSNKDGCNRKPRSYTSTGRKQYFDFLCSNGYYDKQKPSDFMTKHKYSYYWFRGVIDGDGCWYISKNKQSKQFSLSSDYYQDWKYFTDLLDAFECKYSLNRVIGKKGNKYSYIRTCNKNSLSKIINYLYPNDFDFGLTRKYNKTRELLNIFNS